MDAIEIRDRGCRRVVMRRAWAFTFCMGAMSLLVIGSGCDRAGGNAGRGRGDSAVPVSVAKVVKKTVPLELETFGTANTPETIAVKAQVSEVITKVHFQKGQLVHKGDVLFSIEKRPFEIALSQAKATLERDKAFAANLKRDADRVAELFRRKVAAQNEHDQAQAQARAMAMTVAADTAMVENAQLQLDYCTISSPITGRAGNVMVTVGNLVKGSDQTLVVINQISPVDVFFSVTADLLGEVRKRMAAGELSVEALPSGSGSKPEVGKLTFVDNAVDKTTGTAMLGATFTNENERLWPGQFVHVKLTLAVELDALVVPSAAVQAGQNEKYAFVVDADGKAQKRTVTIIRTRGEDSIVQSGLREGDLVVTDGQLQLKHGAKVAIKVPQDEQARAESGPRVK